MAGQKQDGDDFLPVASINITPFVDVVLVLLVIFMITAPMLNKGFLKIKLPKVSSETASLPEKTFGISVTSQGQLLLDGELIDENSLKEKVITELQRSPSLQAIISADKKALHGDVVRVLDLLKSNGLNRFAIQVNREE